MEILLRITLFLASLVNLMPFLLSFLPGRISVAYGVEVPNANYELLLRHRAVFFGIVGVLMLYSAVKRIHYSIAIIIGIISMASFVLMYFIIGQPINAELTRVMYIDMITCCILLAVAIMYYLKNKNTIMH